jgi:hypothetical protein
MRCSGSTLLSFCSNCSNYTGAYFLNDCLKYAYKNSEETLNLLLEDQDLDQEFLNNLLLESGFKDYLILHIRFFMNVLTCYRISKGMIKVHIIFRILYKRFLINEVINNLVPDLKFKIMLPNTISYKELYEIHYNKGFTNSLEMGSVEQQYKKLKAEVRNFNQSVELLNFMAKSGYKLFYNHEKLKHKYVNSIKKLVKNHAELIVEKESKFFVYALTGIKV